MNREETKQAIAVMRDPITEANDQQNEYWKSVGGRTDGVTEAVGWKERYELTLRELPE